MIHSKILGTGSYLPERLLTNHELETMVDTTNEWIIERTGIERRHIAAQGESTTDMGVAAARKAIAAAELECSDIELIIVATATPDSAFPSTACYIQQELGVQGPPALDVSAACSGFVYALSIADQYIRAGTYRHVLVIGAEKLSRVTDWSDRGTCILFADGAGAVVLGATKEEGILATHIHSDGKYVDLLYCHNGIHMPEDEPGPYIQMRGNEVFKVAVRTLSRIVQETLESSNIAPSEIDWLIPHQANIRIIQATAKKLGMSMDQVVVTANDHGNTSAASIPLAMDQAIRDGRIKRGQLIMLEAFGGGFTWGSALIRY